VRVFKIDPHLMQMWVDTQIEYPIGYSDRVSYLP